MAHITFRITVVRGIEVSHAARKYEFRRTPRSHNCFFFFNFVNKEPETYYDFSGGLHVFSGYPKSAAKPRSGHIAQALAWFRVGAAARAGLGRRPLAICTKQRQERENAKNKKKETVERFISGSPSGIYVCMRPVE